MIRRTWLLKCALLTSVGLAICSGCGSNPSPQSANSSPPATEPPSAPQSAPQRMPGPPGVMPTPPGTAPAPLPLIPETPASGDTAPAITPLGTPPDPPATPTESVKADVGVGLKGRSLDSESGVLVEPAKAYFAVREKTIFQISIPHALQLYKALEGAAPKTHEEFMEKIIAENKIKLPQLPPGHVYEWNPEKEELMVRRPVK